MSSRRRPQPKTPQRRKPQPDPYTSRIKKEPSKREREDILRRAVRQRDFDALEAYDEHQVRPPAGAVNEPGITSEIEDGIDWYEYEDDWYEYEY